MSRLPLAQIIQNNLDLNQKMSTTTDTAELIKLSKNQKFLAAQAELASQILDAQNIIAQNQEALNTTQDPEMKELLDLEISEKKALIPQLEADLLSYLAPPDQHDNDDILLEIRAGAGGDESSLFAADLLRMYSYLCPQIDLKINVISSHQNPLGGYKEVIAEVRGTAAYSWFKYEGGVHRVQRVPSTEKQGRIHTSTCSVAIMPLIESDNSDFKLDLKEVEIVATTSQGAGGQSVNTTYSAIKVKHLPTGIEAQCQDERSQAQNKIKALQVLTSRVFDHFEQIRLAAETDKRSQQVGTADRSEKIRTYNYPQDRVTDHRYNHSWNQLPSIMEGGVLRVIRDIRRFEAEKTIQEIGI